MKKSNSSNLNDADYSVVMGAALREERKRQGIRIEMAAKALGITSSYISQIETGKKNPTISVIENYATFLGLDLFELSLRVRILRSPNKKALNHLKNDLSGKLEVVTEMINKGKS